MVHSSIAKDDQGIGEKRFDVGCVYEVDHLNLPTRIPVQLKSISVVMGIEKTELSVLVWYPSIGSLCNYFSHNKMSSTDIYPFLHEVFVIGTHLAGKVLCRQISVQEFNENNHFEGFWLTKNSPEPAALRGIFNKETNSNGMVRWNIRRRVKYSQRDSSTSHPQTSTSSVQGSKEKLDHESDEDNTDENDDEDNKVESDDEDNEDVEEEREDTYEDDMKAVKRKRYSLNTGKAKKVKRETRSYKTMRNQCKKMIDGSINQWSAEWYKLAEKNLLEVMKSKGALFKSLILRLEARKRIGYTGLLDHLLKHLSGKLAPGGAERFRRRHNADGRMEYWLESAEYVNVRKEAGVQDPYWTPGGCPYQDPLCAKEFRLLKEENLKIKRTSFVWSNRCLMTKI